MKKRPIMKQKSHVSTFLIFLLLLPGALSMFTRDLYAEPQSQKGTWFNLGLGGGDIHGRDRIALSTSLTFRKVNTTYSIRYAGLVTPFSDVMYGNAWDLGVLYGRVLTRPSSLFLISGGIGLGLGNILISIDYETVIGVPIEVQFFLKPSPSFGIGFYGFANLNARHSFYGVTLCLTIGRS